ncbi:MAG TPA: hypothetical protein PKX31_00400 [Chitinophagaceae bacterium]|nr:hypothetical protein [Chitinophagaceae bacterium]
MDKDKIKQYKREHYLANKEKYHEDNKKYREENKDKIRESKKQYNINNKEKIKERQKRYYLNNQDKIKSYRFNNKEKISSENKEYCRANRDKINAQIRLRKKTNPKPMLLNNRLKNNLRRRIVHVIRGNNKSAVTMKLIGCDIDFLKTHLSSKFTTGMTWENYGLYGWHIDHIKPCASFDLSNPIEQTACFHYTNLQPLWATKEIALSYGEGLDYVGNLEKGSLNFSSASR